MLLIQTLVKADLSKVPVAGVGGALLLSVLLMSLLCLALRPLLARFSVDGPAFTSIFQGATRWQTYVALAVSGNLFGDARAGAGLGRDGRHHPAGQRIQRRRARPLRFAGKALGRLHHHDRGAQSPDLGLRDRARAQRYPYPASQTVA